MSARDVRNFLQNLISAKGNEKIYEEYEKIYEVLRTVPSTLTLLREYTSANSVSMSACSKRSNQGISTIQRTPPTPLLGSGNGPAMLFGYEKSDEALISSGPSTWSLSNQGISNIQGTRICPCAPTRRAGYVRNGPFTFTLVRENTSANNVLLSARFKRSNHGRSTIGRTRLCFNAPTPVVDNGCNDILTSILAMAFDIEKLEDCQLTGTTGNLYVVPGSVKSLVLASIKADLEAERKVTSEAMTDGPKDKPGNEATAAQSLEEDALRSLPWLYKDLPSSTSAQADNYEEPRLEYYQSTDLAEMELEFALDFVPTMIEAERKAMMYGPKDKSGNEVAADDAQSHEEGALRSPSLEGPYRDSPGSTSAQADNNEKVEKTLFERIGPHVRTTKFIAGAFACAFAVRYFFSQNDVHVKMSNEKANEVNQKTITSSPSVNLNFYFNFANGNFSINFGNGIFELFQGLQGKSLFPKMKKRP